jgi:hypothetical protein
MQIKKNVNIQTLDLNWPLTIRILGFSNSLSWLTSFFLLMDMSILTRGLKHIFLINQLDYNNLFWSIHLVKLNNPSQNGQWIMVKWAI